jgi:methylated-DNA-[protein]-cysteine S-methyltransferase
MKRLKRLDSFPAEIEYGTMDSPVGELTIMATNTAIYTVLWEKESNSDYARSLFKRCTLNNDNLLIVKTKQQLYEYFLGQRQQFDLPIELVGTPFQVRAWQALCAIPYGETISYKEQSIRLGDKNKARAVGMANGMNPISIIVPCHRVIGSNGQLTGFGGGLDNKQKLLTLEQQLII